MSSEIAFLLPFILYSIVLILFFIKNFPLSAAFSYRQSYFHFSGYPGNQHPGQSCLEARTMHLKQPGKYQQSLTNSTNTPRRPSSSNSSWRIRRMELHSPYKHTGKIGWQGQTEAFKRPVTTASKPDQSKTVRLQNQVKRLMVGNFCRSYLDQYIDIKR